MNATVAHGSNITHNACDLNTYIYKWCPYNILLSISYCDFHEFMNVFSKFRHTKDVILFKKTIKGGAMAFARATMLVYLIALYTYALPEPRNCR
jgi:hypothetical protein